MDQVSYDFVEEACLEKGFKGGLVLLIGLLSCFKELSVLDMLSSMGQRHKLSPMQVVLPCRPGFLSLQQKS